MDEISGRGFRFLFRQDQGLVSRAAFWRGAGLLALPLALAGAGWLGLARYAEAPQIGDLPQASLGTALAHAYLIAFALLILLVAICFYNLAAKRFRATRQAPALAALLPLAALLAGASHWMIPRVGDALPAYSGYAVDAAVCLVALWTAVTLSRSPT